MKIEALRGRTVAGRFTLRSLLGEGGMATVWVAEQAGEPREIALKIMNEELTSDRTFLKRFEREAKAASAVRHPSSVEIYDYGTTDDGIVYIAMELLRGQDLYALLEANGALSQARAARLIAEVCDALVVAHEAGIVHRDLKPENIMILEDASRAEGERVKVLDFGIAKLLLGDARGAGEVSAVTRIGSLIGTPAYMSPEQCGLREVDTRSDLYTCGVLLFQIVTGRLPFEGETPLQTAMLHVHQEPPRPSEIAPAIDPHLEALILKALSKSPADRHPTALHLASSLRRLVAEGLPDVPATRAAIPRRSLSSVRPLKSTRPTKPVPAPSQEMLDAASRSDGWINLRELILEDEDRRPSSRSRAEARGPSAPSFSPDSPRAATEPPPSTDPPARIWSPDDRVKLGISESGEMIVPVYDEQKRDPAPPVQAPRRAPRVDTLRSLPTPSEPHPAIPPPPLDEAAPGNDAVPPSPKPVVIRHAMEPAFQTASKSRLPLVIIALVAVIAFAAGLYLLLSR